MITGLTSNHKKAKEYSERLWMYGIRSSFVVRPEMNETEIRDLLSSQKEGSLVFRETSDLVVNGERVNDSYRDESMRGAPATHECRMKVWVKSENEVKLHETMHVVSGHIRTDAPVPEDAFDWDEVFVPSTHSRTYHETLLFSGKVSARQAALDDMVSTHLAFRSNRAFKYGRVGPSGMVDLNHWPVTPSAPIQFSHLPFDDLMSNPVFQRSGILDTSVGRMLRSALSDGAHYRAATNKREWIYWAPGVNAGIPLTPKEDPWSELVYLTHDYAHYAVPDLVPGPDDDGFTKRCYVAHRMIGETMAMVTADMFLMDAFVHAGEAVDADKHGIYAAYLDMRHPKLPQAEQFGHVLGQAVDILLLGEKGQTDALARFAERYKKFALADYEWTMSNVTAMHDTPGVLSAWRRTLSRDVLEDLSLIEARDFAVWVSEEAGGRDVDFPEILKAATRVVLEKIVTPRMRLKAQKTREEVLSLTVKRYFAGQACMYAAHPDVREGSAGFSAIKAVLAKPAVNEKDAAETRLAVSGDIDLMLKQHRITAMDARVYHSVFPITKPTYVSYSAPNLRDHDEVIQALNAMFPTNPENDDGMTP